MQLPHSRYEKLYKNKGFSKIIGIDEAGRGAWAGPVVAASFLYSDNLSKIPRYYKNLIRDSKTLSAPKRSEIFAYLSDKFIYSVGVIDSKKVDLIGILRATQLAMLVAAESLAKKADFILVDGTGFWFKTPYKNIIKGDSQSIAIAAASIFAKVTRDNLMIELDQKYPEFEFASHKGYGTRNHRRNIKKHGICSIHRKSFRPIFSVL